MSSTSRRAMTPDAASTPSAIGRSKEDPALRTSAGARFTMMRCWGNSYPEFRMALRMRSRLSRTLASGRPTTVKAGRPNDTSTSMVTGEASMPKTAAERTRASMAAADCNRARMGRRQDCRGKHASGRQGDQKDRRSDGTAAAGVSHLLRTLKGEPFSAAAAPAWPAGLPGAGGEDLQLRAGCDAVAREAVPALDLRDGGVEELRD